MTNKPKAIGTAAEMAVVRYLEGLGRAHVYRPALQGTLDLGDVHYRAHGGHLVVISVKGGRMAETASPEAVAAWVEEVHAQAQRAAKGGAVSCFVVTKRAGVGAQRAGLWRAYMADARGVIWSTDLASMVACHG